MSKSKAAADLTNLTRLASMYRLPILMSLLLATLGTNRAAAQPPTRPTYFTEVCRSGYGNYTHNSTYHDNLRRVFSNIERRASSSPSDALTIGKGPDQVYGQYYCRGDIQIQLCVACIRAAAQNVLRNCSNTKAAIMWYEECTLRYANQSLSGEEAEYPRSWWSSDKNVSDPSPSRFSALLQGTVDGLIEDAVRGNGSRPGFATKEVVVSNSSDPRSLYSLVQCSPDLNGTQCATCLRSAFGFMPTCCGNSSTWLYVFYPVCQVRYSTLSPFYALTPSS